MNVKEFIESAYVYESYPTSGLETWECASSFILWEFYYKLFPLPDMNESDKLDFSFDENFHYMQNVIVDKLKRSFDNDLEEMLSSFEE